MAIKIEEIQYAIQRYNYYRTNIVKAELVKYNHNKLTIRFDGYFCQTCGYYDYFEDLQILLEDDFSIKTKIENIENSEEADIVQFKIL